MSSIENESKPKYIYNDLKSEIGVGIGKREDKKNKKNGNDYKESSFKLSSSP